MSRAVVLAGAASVLIVAVQVALISPLRIAGVVVMLVWLWPLALGLVGSTPVAVVAGFVAGLLFDAQSPTPFGAGALVGAALGGLVSILAREGVGDLDGSNWLVPVVLVGLGGLVAPLLYVAAAALLGQPRLYQASLLATMVVNAVAFAILARPAARLVQGLARAGGWART